MDAVIRVLVNGLSREWKVPVATENRSGSGGVLGTEIAARSAPDGYTLLATTQTHYTNAYTHGKLSYDPTKFVPVVRFTAAPLVIVAGLSAKFNNVKELIDEAKLNPGKLTYASAGIGSSAHMAGALLGQLSGSNMLHVAYKEYAQSLPDTIAGRVSINALALPTALPLIKAGKLKAIAVTTSERVSQLPDVPTVSESGAPGYQFVPWHAMFAPPGTPPAIVQKISSSVLSLKDTPEFRRLIDVQGLVVFLDGADDFAVKLPRENATWATLIKSAGVKAD